MKSIRELSWNVTEDEYRQDKSLSYSKLSSFLRDGPSILVKEEKKNTESLRFGSLVDCLLTEPETLEERFVISDFDKPSPTIMDILDYLWENSDKSETIIEKLDEKLLLQAAKELSYGGKRGYKKATIIKNLLEGQEYFSLKPLTEGKILVHQDDFNDAKECVRVLHEHPFTSKYICSPEDPNIEHCYQLKFKIMLYNIYPVRCMLDKVIIDHRAKTIQPIDLKTTGKKESEFEHSVLDWNYYIQATLYSDIIRSIISTDSYFSGFTVLPFKFIVINRFRKKPIVWNYNTEKMYTDGTRTALMNKGYKDYLNLLDEIKWHYETGQYDYSYDIYKNEGTIDLDLKRLL